jgi:hypothetical protein
MPPAGLVYYYIHHHIHHHLSLAYLVLCISALTYTSAEDLASWLFFLFSRGGCPIWAGKAFPNDPSVSSVLPAGKKLQLSSHIHKREGNNLQCIIRQMMNSGG